MIITNPDPATEPVTTADAKAHLQVEHTSDDDYIASLVSTARAIFEQLTNRATTTRSVTVIFDYDEAYSGELPLPIVPLNGGSLTSFKYYSVDMATKTAQNSTDYYVQAADPASIIPINNGFQADRLKRTWEVVYTAGYSADETSVPADIAHAIKMIVKLLYTYPEGVNVGNIINKLGIEFEQIIIRRRHLDV